MNYVIVSYSHCHLVSFINISAGPVPIPLIPLHFYAITFDQVDVGQCYVDIDKRGTTAVQRFNSTRSKYNSNYAA